MNNNQSPKKSILSKIMYYLYDFVLMMTGGTLFLLMLGLVDSIYTQTAKPLGALFYLLMLAIATTCTAKEFIRRRKDEN